MNENRKIILGLGIVISFALLIFSISLYFNYAQDLRQEDRLTSASMDNMSVTQIKEILEERQSNQPTFKSYYLFPFIAFIGLLVGTTVFYIMSDKINKQEETVKKNSKVILNFLNGQERKVIETLIENGGKVQQYELSHLPNLNKLKTHRILTNLEQKGIIHKEKLGKINKIVLNKELFDVLKE